MPDLPTPTRLSPIRDDHAWHFPDINGHRTHVRLRVWPTNDGGHLVIATDLQLGAGLINVVESLVRACVREFGPPVGFYNPRRRHSAAGGLPPEEFERTITEARKKSDQRCQAA